MLVRWARWLLTLVGGILLGGGLILHGQIAMIRYLRDEVESTFFLWRAIGEAVLFLQGPEVRLALAMSQVPEVALRESYVAAWTLVAVGTFFAIIGPLLPVVHHADGGKASASAGRRSAKRSGRQAGRRR